MVSEALGKDIMVPSMAASGKDQSWLTHQVKLMREQLDKKSSLCDQLASELRRLEGELDTKNAAVRESRDLLRSTTTELRAAAQAGDAARAKHEEETAALRAEAETLRREARSGDAGQPLGEDLLLELEGLRREAESLRREARGGDAGQPLSEDLMLELEMLRREAQARGGGEQSDPDYKELRLELDRERELHREALRLLHATQNRDDEEVAELQQELARVGAGLEQKEQEMLGIQFDMVYLQNSLRDQAQLVASNAEAFQQASEELADKDEALEMAMTRQEELVQQINEVSTQLQDKVGKLSDELESSRAANQALEEQTRVRVKSLQTDRDAARAELERLRAEHAAQLAAVQPAGGEALARAEEQLQCARTEIEDLRAALERSRLCERQAAERAQEYRTSLELYREFGAEFLMGAPRPGSPTSGGGDATGDRDDGHLGSVSVAGDAAGEVALRRVLIAVELDLGCGRAATLEVAPWQTRSDFDEIVSDFLRENKVKPFFTEALIAFLEEVEEQAESFPKCVKANLSEIHSAYG